MWNKTIRILIKSLISYRFILFLIIIQIINVQCIPFTTILLWATSTIKHITLNQYMYLVMYNVTLLSYILTLVLDVLVLQK